MSRNALAQRRCRRCGGERGTMAVSARGRGLSYLHLSCEPGAVFLRRLAYAWMIGCTLGLVGWLVGL